MKTPPKVFGWSKYEQNCHIREWKDMGFKYVKYLTTQTECVCDICKAMDGKVFSINEPPQIPPNGCHCLGGCGSILGVCNEDGGFGEVPTERMLSKIPPKLNSTASSSVKISFSGCGKVLGLVAWSFISFLVILAFWAIDFHSPIKGISLLLVVSIPVAIYFVRKQRKEGVIVNDCKLSFNEMQQKMRKAYSKASGEPLDGSPHIKVHRDFGKIGIVFTGVLFSILGIVLIISGAGFIAGVVCLLIGLIFGAIAKNALWCECSECGTKLAHKKVKICPACHARFGQLA